MLYHADVFLGKKRVARVSGLQSQEKTDSQHIAVAMTRTALGLDRTVELFVQLKEFGGFEKWLKGWPRLSPTGVGMGIAHKNGILPRDIYEALEPTVRNPNELVEELEEPKTNPHPPAIDSERW